MGRQLEQLNHILNDINHKLSTIKDGSKTQTFLLLKKQDLENALQKIVDDFKKRPSDYELYSLSDKMEILKDKIYAKASKPTDEDEDVKEYKELETQHNWILRLNARSC